MKFTVLGAGSWGMAMSMVLSDNGHEVAVYGRNSQLMEDIQNSRVSTKYLPGTNFPEGIRFTSNLSESLSGAQAIIIAVSTQAVRSVLEDSKEYLPKNAIIVNLAKGIENDTLLRVSEIAAEIAPNNPFVALSGPSHAEEVAKKMATTLVASSTEMKHAMTIQQAVSNNYIRVYTNPDIVGVELGGALKNIIALAAGVIDGMGFGDNTKAALMTRGIREIARLGEKMGAKEATFKGLTGIGDLIVTCTSMHSRNRRCGILLGEGKSIKQAQEEIGMVVESLSTIKAAYELSIKMNVDMPITEELYKVIYEGCSPFESLGRLMQREAKSELEEQLNW